MQYECVGTNTKTEKVAGQTLLELCQRCVCFLTRLKTAYLLYLRAGGVGRVREGEGEGEAKKKKQRIRPRAPKKLRYNYPKSTYF